MATFQLVIQQDQAFVSIHYITNEEDSADIFERLRVERDALIHTAQVKELQAHPKPALVKREDRVKEQYLHAVADVTKRIKEDEVNKVVIARSLKLTFDEGFFSSNGYLPCCYGATRKLFIWLRKW